jgi:hypothetical protein
MAAAETVLDCADHLPQPGDRMRRTKLATGVMTTALLLPPAGVAAQADRAASLYGVEGAALLVIASDEDMPGDLFDQRP